MELRHLRYFVAVAEEMHFGRAARRLNISQPPLSIQIRHLEEELGVTLFVRKKAIELTPAGKEFLIYATGALLKVQQGMRSAQRVQQGEVGELSVGFMGSMAYTYLPWQLKFFREKFPGVELKLYEQDTRTQLKALHDGDLNVGIVRGPICSRGLSAVKILTEPLIVALPVSHRCAQTREVSVAELAEDCLIMFPRRVGGSLNDEVTRLCDRAGFSPKVSQEVIQLHVVVSLVSAGIGIAIVPESTRLFSVSGVVFRPLVEKNAHVSTEVVFREDDSSQVVREFLAVARDVASGGLSGLERFRTAVPDLQFHSQ